jgi:hypothetical protein
VIENFSPRKAEYENRIPSVPGWWNTMSTCTGDPTTLETNFSYRVTGDRNRRISLQPELLSDSSKELKSLKITECLLQKCAGFGEVNVSWVISNYVSQTRGINSK